MKKTYVDFDLSIQREKEGYRSRVLRAPAGEALGDFTLPFSEVEIENLLLRIGRRRHTVRRIDSPEARAAQAFGEKLFRAAFPEAVRDCLRGSLDAASSQGAGLRLRLRLNEVPELADLPWEYLWDPIHKRYFGLSTETPIVRYLELPERIRPLAVQPPLQILTLISSPSGFVELDTEREWNRLNEALGPLVRRGLVALDRSERPTLIDLRRRLRQKDYHIFHFVGHGGFDSETHEGVLALEDEAGRPRLVSGHDLAILLHDRRTLRLAVLNACEGARASRTDPFAGTAQCLVQGGIPSVIAMQFEISDQAAITFAAEFYQAVSEGFPVDAALAEARLAVFFKDNGLEWGTPVLYLRAPDGQIFDVEVQTVLQNREEMGARPVSPVLLSSKPEPSLAETSALQPGEDLRTKPAPPALPWSEPEPEEVKEPESLPKIEQRRPNLPRAKAGPKYRPKAGSRDSVFPIWRILAVTLVVIVIAMIFWKSLTPGSVPTPQAVERCVPGQVRAENGIVFVRICPGTFTMGSAEDDLHAYGDEMPAHQVTLKGGLWIGKTEITNQQYRRFQPNHQGEDELPATGIRWNDAKAACEFLGGRLPTEAEWEYAARAGTQTAWSFGSDDKRLADYAWYEENGGDNPHPVATRKPNAWGLYDMHGNVWEWVADWYATYERVSQTDPVGPKTSEQRSMRGGSFINSPWNLRSAIRYGNQPTDRGRNIGFRCARSPSRQP